MQTTGTAAIVTGAASGLGAATAAALAAQGAIVYGIDLGKGIAEATPPDGVTLHAADVTEEDPVRNVLARIAEDGAELRAVVNCAGIGPSARILGEEGPHDLELFRDVLEINLLGTFNVMRLGAEMMSKLGADNNGQRGVIVNTSSIVAFEGPVGRTAYAASKAGLVGMTITAARDLAQFGIRVMTIAPGLVETPMLGTVTDELRTAMGAVVPFPQRLAQPAEFARLVLMIVEHDYLNGETIRMDGALRLAPS